MDELMNLMIADESPSEISDSIKNQLFAKFYAAEELMHLVCGCKCNDGL